MSGVNILVAVKSRPFISREKLGSQWNIQEKSIYQIDEKLHRIGQPYSFDHVFTEKNTNADVYNTVVEPLIRSCFEGFNSTIFAYGQTSSGKTYTMMGNKNTPGLIQLAVNDIFKQVQQDKQRRYLISCSYFEIYNEKINNLLVKNENDLIIHEDHDGNTFLSAKEEVVTTPNQVFEVMDRGNKIRKIGCTDMNERSSRSHSIFRFTIESTDNSIENGPVQVSQLNLVDLAGSERVARARAEGKRLREGVTINKSLTVLGYVIRQLSNNERHISYRDSKLTRLLQQALGGNAKSLIIATITLAAGEETKSTLEFAQRAKGVKNRPIINEILSESDKLKKHELIISDYKERLDIEKKRMHEMEIRFQQDRQTHEKEIDKLLKQTQLIALFAKGPSQASKPELTFAPSTSYTRGKGSTRKPTSTVGSEDSDEEILKIEETSDSVLAEPMDESLHSTMETPPSFLHKKMESLEESSTSPKEFTKLESESKEKDKESLEELVKERENLLKDLNDLNAMYQSERQEKEALKLMYIETEASLKAQLDDEVKKISLRLEQIETANDQLEMARTQELNDHEFTVDYHAKNYKTQLEYNQNIIRKLYQQAESDQTQIESLKQKIYELEGKNLSGEAAEIYHPEEESFKRKEGAIIDVLSTTTQTDIETEDNKEKLKQLEEKIVKTRQEECGDMLPEDDKISSLMAQVEELTGENALLKYKVQRFENEVEALKKQGQSPALTTVKSCPELGSYGKEKKECDMCERKEDYIKKLENLHEAFSFKKVDLQTKFDLNSADVEKNKRDEVEKMLRFENSQLKEKLRIGQPVEVKDSEVQCDLLDYDTLKQLVLKRREEANILRAKLGVKPDEPVQ